MKVTKAKPANANARKAKASAPAPEVKSYARKADGPLALTPAEYSGLQQAYDHFNRELFASQLPDLLITFQRKAHMRGFYSAERFAGRAVDVRHDELALNPDGFIGRDDQAILSTLVHEQVHVWQFHYGRRPSRGYHDKQWGAKMKEIGLHPSATGEPGGKETGSRVTHYIVPGGPYALSFAKLAATGWKLNLQSATRPADPRKPPAPSSKTKFTCPHCQQNAWGKPDLQIVCGPCTIEVFDKIIARLTDRKQIASAENSRNQITGHARLRAEAIGALTLDRTNYN